MTKFLQALGGLLFALVALAIVAWISMQIWQGLHTTNALATAVRGEGAAVVGQAQARATTDATQIVVSGQRRDQLDINVHQENARAIADAPGADAPLDPALIAAVNNGLHRYGEPTDRHDPDGVPLRPDDPAVVPEAGAGGAGPY